MKRIKSFRVFESEVGLTREQVGILNECVRGTWRLNPGTGLVDVEGDVVLSGKGLTRVPVRFGLVSGSFNCVNNQLSTLEGAPESVGGFFDCSNNRLTTLEGAPESVGVHFSCSNNRLTTLEGAPKSVGGYFSCSNNRLTTLEGAPESVGRGFDCVNNKLSTLEGAPGTVGGNFSCSNNRLTTLEGAPESVGGHFNCVNNQLSTLEGAPKSVGGFFDCSNNRLTTLEGAPESVGGHLYLSGNPVSESTLETIYNKMLELKIPYLSALLMSYSEITNKRDSDLLYVDIDPVEIVRDLLRDKIPVDYEDLFKEYPSVSNSLTGEELDLARKLTRRWRIMQRS